MTFINVFFNNTATTEIYTLSLHDALPIYSTNVTATQFPAPNLTTASAAANVKGSQNYVTNTTLGFFVQQQMGRSEEHTSELQSRQYLVCRLLLEKKNKKHIQTTHTPRYSL